MIKYKDKEIAGYKDVDADTVVIRYADGKEEIVRREDLVDDLQMLKGPGDQMPKVTRTIPGKEINIHIPDREVEIVQTKEQKAEADKAEKATKNAQPKAPWLS